MGYLVPPYTSLTKAAGKTLTDVSESQNSNPSIEPLRPTQAWKIKANIVHNNFYLT